MIPFADILRAVYARLSADMETPVYSAGAVPVDQDAPYVVLQVPTAVARRSQTTLGHNSRLVIRVHTRYPKGRASQVESLEIADGVTRALGRDPLNLRVVGSGEHRLLDLPPADPETSIYESGDFTAVDTILRYRLLTQHIR